MSGNIEIPDLKVDVIQCIYCGKTRKNKAIVCCSKREFKFLFASEDWESQEFKDFRSFYRF